MSNLQEQTTEQLEDMLEDVRIAALEHGCTEELWNQFFAIEDELKRRNALEVVTYSE